MYFTYILISYDRKKTYTGSTNDVDRRLEEHNSGKNKFTKAFRPFEMLHLDRFDTLREAIQMEKFYKSITGRRRIKGFIEQWKITSGESATKITS